MIKLTSVIEVVNPTGEEKIKNASEKFRRELETAEDFHMEPPEVPVLRLGDEELDEVRYKEYINPEDIKKMSRVDQRTILSFYDGTNMIVLETPEKIEKLKHSYNEKHPSNTVRIYNINLPFTIPDTGEF